MKILAISHLFPHMQEPRYGIFVARQLKAMTEVDKEITVLVPSVYCPAFLRKFKRWNNFRKNSELLKFNGLKTIRTPYIRLPGNWYNRWSGLAAYLSIKNVVKKLHKIEEFDIIYATDFFPDGDIAARLGKYLNIPATCLGIGIDVNQTANDSKILSMHFNRIANSLNGTLACGKSVADKIQIVTGQKSLCVYGVVDLEKYQPVVDKREIRKELGLSNDSKYLLYAGYLDKRKGVYELLNAFSRLKAKKNNIKLILCGDGSERENLKKHAVEKKIENSVIMPGMIEPEVMHKWIQASNLFVLPSYSEGMPNVIMEAMSCGVPVIATTVGGLPEAVGNSNGAILVEPKDVENLYYAIDKVISNDGLLIPMGKAARRLAEEKFDVKQNAKRIVDFLQMIVEKENRI